MQGQGQGQAELLVIDEQAMRRGPNWRRGQAGLGQQLMMAQQGGFQGAGLAVKVSNVLWLVQRDPLRKWRRGTRSPWCPRWWCRTSRAADALAGERIQPCHQKEDPQAIRRVLRVRLLGIHKPQHTRLRRGQGFQPFQGSGT